MARVRHITVRPSVVPSLELDRVVRAFAGRIGASRRQVEVFVLLAEGRSRAAIAEAMGCSAGTVDEHVRRFCRKAGRSGTTRSSNPRFEDVLRSLLEYALRR